MKFKVGTAFSGGYGSVEFALKLLDIPHKVKLACEIDEKARELYGVNYGTPKLYPKDINHFLKSKEIKKLKLDYYHLSPPCQSYSLSGNREGLGGDKGLLMKSAIESIAIIQPEVFTIENVRGLLSVNKGEDWDNILADIEALKGYKISWGLYNALDFGGVQSRVRVFVIGVKDSYPLKKLKPKKRYKKTPRILDMWEKNVEAKYYISKQKKEWLRGRERAGKTMTRYTKKIPTLMASYHKRGTDISLLKCKMSKQRGTKDKFCVRGHGNRYLTPREFSRFQGDYKDEFDFGKLANVHLYQCIGNAMELNMTKALVELVVKILKKRKRDKT